MVPQGPFKVHRLDFIQQIVNAFWKRWSRDVFPLLVPSPKWHVYQRNVEEGDVVLVQDSNQVRGEWRRGIVRVANPSRDGKVRRVTIECSNGSTKVVLERAVQRLVVLVPANK